jgi:hypothetical protein
MRWNCTEGRILVTQTLYGKVGDQAGHASIWSATVGVCAIRLVDGESRFDLSAAGWALGILSAELSWAGSMRIKVQNLPALTTNGMDGSEKSHASTGNLDSGRGLTRAYSSLPV